MENDNVLELVNAANLQSNNDVLLVSLSSKYNVAQLSKFVKSVKAVNNKTELNRIIVDDEKFDRIIIGYGSVLDVTPLLKKGGYVCSVSTNGNDKSFANAIDHNYLGAHVWSFDLSDGSRLNMADATGVALRHTNGQF